MKGDKTPLMEDTNKDPLRHDKKDSVLLSRKRS